VGEALKKKERWLNTIKSRVDENAYEARTNLKKARARRLARDKKERKAKEDEAKRVLQRKNKFEEEMKLKIQENEKNCLKHCIF